MKLLPKLLPIAAAGLTATAMWAQPAGALTEAEARAFIDELLSFYAPRPGSPGGVVVASEPTLAPDGAGYSVSLAEVGVALNGSMVGLGDIRLNVQPADGKRLALSVALPPRATLTEADAPIGEILLGERKFTGLWDPSLFSFVKLDIAIESIETNAGAKILARTGPLSLTREAVQVAEARWNSVTTFQAAGVEFGQFSSALGRITAMTARSQLSDIDLASYGALVQALQFDPMSVWSQWDTSEEALNAVADFYEHVAVGRIDSTFAATGLQIRGGEPGAEDEKGVSIGQALFVSAWSDVAAGRGTLSGQIAFREVNVEGLAQPPLEHLLPEALDLDIEITHLPMAAMLRSVSGVVQQIAELPEEGVPMAQVALLGELQRLLEESGTVLRLRRARLAAPATVAELQAEARVDSAAVYGAAGELTLEVDGIEAAIERLRADPANGDANRAALILMLLQGLGEPITPEPGASRLRYHITVGSDGMVLLNGNEIGPVLEMLR